MWTFSIGCMTQEVYAGAFPSREVENSVRMAWVGGLETSAKVTLECLCLDRALPWLSCIKLRQSRIGTRAALYGLGVSGRVFSRAGCTFSAWLDFHNRALLYLCSLCQGRTGLILPGETHVGLRFRWQCVCMSVCLCVCVSVWVGQWVCGILISLNSAVARSATLSLNKMNDSGLWVKEWRGREAGGNGVCWSMEGVSVWGNYSCL